ncbi:MAG: type II toxin-antitoxin system HicA family toxin [Chthoniobacteraceae bacterium]
MPRRLSSEEVARILKSQGFSLVSQKGSHQKFRDASGHSAIVPAGRREIPAGTLASIIRQSGLGRDLFV